MRIVLASPRAGGLAEFVAGLVAGGAEVEACATGAAALESARTVRPDLAVIDENLPDLEPGRLVVALLLIDATISTAILSVLSGEEFHERTEGLGILARVPPSPGREDAAALLAALRGLDGS
ncbi:MAG: hypothetical protein AB1916_07215 [Thermodesulfobacteriota bacterium]